MRWFKQQDCNFGETMIRAGFLLFPKCINGEWRWLEEALLKQRLEVCRYGIYWEDEMWLKSPY